MTRALLALLLVLSITPAPRALMAQRAPYPAVDYRQRDPLAGIAPDNWLTPADTLHRARFRTSVAVGTGLYLAAGTGLYAAWYKDYELQKFHFFNDWPQWEQMDKAGHVYTAYFFSRNAFAGLRWAGLKRPAARYAALGIANLLQGTIETMDGFSSNWGFSVTDLGANVAGSLVFTLQDIAWKEQRMVLKVSHDLRPVPNVPVTNAKGATSNLGVPVRERFGDNLLERYLKDYNAQTIWLSVNPKSFARQSGLPDWLNVAVGYGVEDVYGAYFNSWRDGGQSFSYQRDARRRQWFLSPDVYFSRIPTRKRWVRMVLGFLDFVKVPAPALEYSEGRWYGHWIM